MIVVEQARWQCQGHGRDHERKTCDEFAQTEKYGIRHSESEPSKHRFHFNVRDALPFTAPFLQYLASVRPFCLSLSGKGED